MTESTTTHFGYERVANRDKAKKVAEVFTSVSSKYDLMNDVMSFGIHRLWKQFAIHIAAVRPGNQVLDLAGGTGDLSEKLLKRVGPEGKVTIADINLEMLSEGRNKLIDKGHIKGFDYVQANAECLPFAANQFDFISIAFGLRNVTDKQKALQSMYDCLGFGAQLMILEFSKLSIPLLQKTYDQFSFNFIPFMGKIIADDEKSYRYLVESIRMHPDQETLKSMMEKAGFSKVEYKNLSGGIVAIHTGYKI